MATNDEWKPGFSFSIATRAIERGAALLNERDDKLESLKIRSKDGDFMPDELASALANAPCLQGIRRLEIEEIDLGKAALTAIATAEHYSSLRYLALLDCDWHSKLGAAIPEAISASSHLDLHSFEILSSRIGEAGAKSIAAGAGGFRNLRRLKIAASDFGDAGLQALLGSTLFQGLEELFLIENQIGEDGVRALLSTPLPKTLKKFHFHELGMSKETKAAIKTAFGSAHRENIESWVDTVGIRTTPASSTTR